MIELLPQAQHEKALKIWNFINKKSPYIYRRPSSSFTSPNAVLHYCCKQRVCEQQLALSNFNAGIYDVALLDIKMPQMNGFDLYRKLKV